MKIPSSPTRSGLYALAMACIALTLFPARLYMMKGRENPEVKVSAAAYEATRGKDFDLVEHFKDMGEQRKKELESIQRYLEQDRDKRREWSNRVTLALQENPDLLKNNSAVFDSLIKTVDPEWFKDKLGEQDPRYAEHVKDQPGSLDKFFITFAENAIEKGDVEYLEKLFKSPVEKESPDIYSLTEKVEAFGISNSNRILPLLKKIKEKIKAGGKKEDLAKLKQDMLFNLQGKATYLADELMPLMDADDAEKVYNRMLPLQGKTPERRSAEGFYFYSVEGKKAVEKLKKVETAKKLEALYDLNELIKKNSGNYLAADKWSLRAVISDLEELKKDKDWRNANSDLAAVIDAGINLAVTQAKAKIFDDTLLFGRKARATEEDVTNAKQKLSREILKRLPKARAERDEARVNEQQATSFVPKDINKKIADARDAEIKALTDLYESLGTEYWGLEKVEAELAKKKIDNKSLAGLSVEEAQDIVNKEKTNKEIEGLLKRKIQLETQLGTRGMPSKIIDLIGKAGNTKQFNVLLGKIESFFKDLGEKFGAGTILEKGIRADYRNTEERLTAAIQKADEESKKNLINARDSFRLIAANYIYDPVDYRMTEILNKFLADKKIKLSDFNQKYANELSANLNKTLEEDRKKYNPERSLEEQVEFGGEKIKEPLLLEANVKGWLDEKVKEIENKKNK